MRVSRICLGCMSYGKAKATPWPDMLNWPWTLTEEDSRPFIKRALELGINFFDTANVYSIGESEAVLGRAIRDFARRDELVIPKCPWFQTITRLPLPERGLFGEIREKYQYVSNKSLFRCQRNLAAGFHQD